MVCSLENMLHLHNFIEFKKGAFIINQTTYAKIKFRNGVDNGPHQTKVNVVRLFIIYYITLIILVYNAFSGKIINYVPFCV